MRLRDKLEKEQGVEGKILLLDTSSILSDKSALGYPNHKVITSGVLGELYRLAFGNDIARERYEKVCTMLENGDLYLMKSNAYQDTTVNRELDLSPTDLNLIRVAHYFRGAMIISCDHLLCEEARRQGIPAYGIRSNVS